MTTSALPSLPHTNGNNALSVNPVSLDVFVCGNGFMTLCSASSRIQFWSCPVVNTCIEGTHSPDCYRYIRMHQPVRGL